MATSQNADFPTSVHSEINATEFANSGLNLGESNPTQSEIAEKLSKEINATQDKLGIGSSLASAASAGQILVKQADGSVIWSNNTAAVWGSITGTLSAQTDLQNALNAKYDASNPDGFITSADLSGYVPYTGATADLDLGAFELTTGVINTVSGQTELQGNSTGNVQFRINNENTGGATSVTHEFFQGGLVRAQLQYLRSDLTFSIGGSSNIHTLIKAGGTTILTIAVGGATTFQNTTNSTSALRVLNAAGSNIFNVDTTNERVGIGTATPSHALHVIGQQLIRNTGGAAGFLIDRTDGKVFNFLAGGIRSVLKYDQSADFLISRDTRANIEAFTGAGTTVMAFASDGNIGIGTTASTALLQIGTDTTAATGGIHFGTDVNLYRYTANGLRTDDFFRASSGFTSEGTLRIGSIGGLSNEQARIAGVTASNRVLRLLGAAAQSGNYLAIENSSSQTIMSISSTGVLQWADGAGGAVDTNLYRSAANTLKTDGRVDADSYSVAGTAGATGTFTTADSKTVTVTNGIITSIV